MESKQLKDYLHLYFGCQIKVWSDNYNGEDFFDLTPTFLDLANVPHYTIKPILRKLSSMTEEEMKVIFKIVFKRDYRESGTLTLHEKNSREEKRWVAWSGVERVSVAFDGYMWADSDLSNWRYNQHEVTTYLLKQGFDLFGLIESGIAIDSSTIQVQQ